MLPFPLMTNSVMTRRLLDLVKGSNVNVPPICGRDLVDFMSRGIDFISEFPKWGSLPIDPGFGT